LQPTPLRGLLAASVARYKMSLPKVMRRTRGAAECDRWAAGKAERKTAVHR